MAVIMAIVVIAAIIVVAVIIPWIAASIATIPAAPVGVDHTGCQKARACDQGDQGCAPGGIHFSHPRGGRGMRRSQQRR